jgi:hypothetical protein
MAQRAGTHVTGAPHGPTDTHKDQVGRDLLDLLFGKDA